LAHAERFGLLNSAPKRILDLGSGCGYFPFICRSFGHEVFCVDQPGIDIFDDVMDLLGLNRVDLTIRPKTPLGLPWRDIDLVTGLMVKFDAIDDRTRFGRSEWSYLIADLAGYLRGSARIYFELNHLPVCPDIEADNREFFLGKGAKVTGPGLREILIADVEPFRPHA
jgi:hypothetical protein